LYDAWIARAFELNPGEAVFIPIEDKGEQKAVVRIVEDALSRAGVGPSMTLRVSPTFRDKKLWVQIHKRATTHETAFVKRRDQNGNWVVERTSLGTDADRLRTIQVAVEDGLSQGEIEKFIGPLSEAEVLTFFPEGI
jgi:hypothetical protein